MLLRSRVPGFTNRLYQSNACLWEQSHDILVPKFHNVLCIAQTPQGRVCTVGELVASTHNLVTVDGDIFYSQRQSEETTTNDYNSLYLSESNWDATHPNKNSGTDNLPDIIAGSEKLVTALYPRTNDPDTDNTSSGPNVTTWQFAYAAADFTSTGIVAGALAEAGVTSWGTNPGADTLLTGFTLTSTPKQATDTLKMIINHTQTGV